MKTIQSLRQEGNKVRVMHERYVSATSFGAPYLMPLHKIRENGWQNTILSTGGKTTIQLTTKDGRDFESVAKCCPKDSFNRHVALNKAVGRLVGKMLAA